MFNLNLLFSGEASTSFSEEKEAKRLFQSGPWALEASAPWPRVKEVFAALFKKRLLLLNQFQGINL